MIADPDAVASPAVLVAPMMLAPGRLLVPLLGAPDLSVGGVTVV